jgi:DNA-3-methyladenine glycosylase I
MTSISDRQTADRERRTAGNRQIGRRRVGRQTGSRQTGSQPTADGLPLKIDGMEKRCWADARDLLMVRYHDEEWGVPLHDGRKHFEFLVLDAFQAGLSWRTVLHKREAFRRAFAGFDPERVARFGARDLRRLLDDAGIIRNRRKIEASVRNARAFLELDRAPGGFDRHVWSFTGGRTKVNLWTALSQVPARSPESDAMSADLKGRGFSFVGSTICYAYMQAAGMVNDHLVGCPRHRACRRLSGPGRPSGSTRRSPRLPG